MIWNWALAVAHAACPTPQGSAELVSALDDAKDAYASLEVEAFRQAMDGVHQKLPCLDEEVTRHLAAELHRFEGLLGFLDRDTEHSQRAFASARSIEPNYKFPVTLVPDGHPVLAQYGALDPNRVGPNGMGSVRLSEPLQGSILLDGAVTLHRPQDLPVLFQRLDAEGGVLETVYLWPSDPVPPYPARAAPLVVEPAPEGPAPDLVGAVRAGPNKKLLVGAGATALASGLLYGTAFLVNNRYYNVNTDVSRLDSLRRVNNGFVVASGATFVAAVGLGTGALLTGTF
jgi:hypothetical protein